MPNYESVTPGNGTAYTARPTGPPLPDLIGSSAAMETVYRLVRLAAPRQATVLLIGETGTGKEVIARSVHKLSKRAEGPYIRVNCGALHENLLESELFGHVKGAFTGAIENKTGRFEAAHMGTIFLDEINSMSPKLQVKLLRVLQEREFERVGDSKTSRVDVRVIAATNASLEELVETGSFREDLYYRLNVVPIVLPPLRERRDDIEPLVQFFVKRSAEANKIPLPEIPATLLATLCNRDWPGNVRELENTIERLIVLADNGHLSEEHLHIEKPRLQSRTGKNGSHSPPQDMESLVRNLVKQSVQTPLPAGVKLYDFLVGGVERELIGQVMRMCGNVKITAADRLGINRNTLHKKLEEYERTDAISREPTEPS